MGDFGKDQILGYCKCLGSSMRADGFDENRTMTDGAYIANCNMKSFLLYYTVFIIHIFAFYSFYIEFD